MFTPQDPMRCQVAHYGNQLPMKSSQSRPHQNKGKERSAKGRPALTHGSVLSTHIREIIEQRGTGRGGVSITEIAWRAKSNRLACNAVLRAMERRGEAGQYNSSNDRWGSQTWYLL